MILAVQLTSVLLIEKTRWIYFYKWYSCVINNH